VNANIEVGLISPAGFGRDLIFYANERRASGRGEVRD
jgi:hypothetical protein